MSLGTLPAIFSANQKRYTPMTNEVKKQFRALSEHRWNERMLKSEIIDLRREHAHLALKQQQRSLTEWEQQRIGELSKEMRSLLGRLTHVLKGNGLSKNGVGIL